MSAEPIRPVKQGRYVSVEHMQADIHRDRLAGRHLELLERFAFDPTRTTPATPGDFALWLVGRILDLEDEAAERATADALGREGE